MGQKAHPRGFRLSFHKDHYLSSWFASRVGNITGQNCIYLSDPNRLGSTPGLLHTGVPPINSSQTNIYSVFIYEDFLIREFFYKNLQISHIKIKRNDKKIFVYLEKTDDAPSHFLKLDYLKSLNQKLVALLKTKTNNDYLISFEVSRLPAFSAQNLSLKLKKQLENRSPYKKSMKQLVKEAEKAGVKGIKIKISGRLNGAEMARSESESFGKLPLQTIRIPIDYYYTQAYTIFGILGVKIWVYGSTST